MGLLSTVLAVGVNLQTHTPVSAVSSTPDSEGYAAVKTERGILRAKKVVYATNAYTAALLPDFEGKQYRFVMKPTGDYTVHFADPDM